MEKRYSNKMMRELVKISNKYIPVSGIPFARLGNKKYSRTYHALIRRGDLKVMPISGYITMTPKGRTLAKAVKIITKTRPSVIQKMFANKMTKQLLV